MRKTIIVWASDEVLQEYAIFCEKFDPKGVEIIEKYEEHFGNAVLAFRKEIGYKNKHNCITPRQIVLIFKSGWGHKL